jgi:hypothetical protein
VEGASYSFRSDDHYEADFPFSVFRNTASPVGGKGPAKQHFSFDRVLGPEDGQSSVYDVVEP